MSDDRTHQPTAKRRLEARKEGRVAATSLLGGALSWLAISAFVLSASGWLLAITSSHLKTNNPTQSGYSLADLSAGGLGDYVREQVLHAGAFTLPILGAVLGVSMLSRLSQVGFLWLPNRLLPDAKRLDPSQRLATIFSAEKAVQALRGLVLVLSAFALIGWGIWTQQEELLQLLTVHDVELHTVRLIAGWGLRLGCLLVVFAILDYACQRYRFEANLYMSAEEMRAEVKAVEGNTQVASERKAMHQAMRNARELEESSTEDS